MPGHNTSIPRRTFLVQLAAGCSAAGAMGQTLQSKDAPALPAVNALSPLKKKLGEGKSATLLIISDSTGYKDVSGTRRFIRWLATQFPSHRVTESYWAEWETKAPTGPRNYGVPIVIAEGTSKATFTILNAVLPGSVAQAMIDGSRWANVIAPLNKEAPDLILWNHGHNHQAALSPKDYPYGRGGFLAPLGRVGMEFPKTPQAAIIQNPWRDNDGYDRVRDWWLSTAEAMPALTLIDGHTPFIEQKKSADLYQDNVHPSERGYALIYQRLVAAWESTTPQAEVSTVCWSNQAAEPLVANGDLADWTGELPKNWRLINGASARKDTEHTFRNAPYALALTGTKQNDGLQISITGAALAKVKGKTVSFAVLCYVPSEAEQDIQVKFTTNSSDRVTGSAQFARDNWKWIVMAGCPVPADASLAFVGIFRSFAKPPTTDVPFYIQKVVIVEGDAPRGGM
ncbi:SGNH/GDSL hydrolase family protein [Roseimicrobium sp. ORNL1]|uniref:SGNH/GDSL hydrolase family protein n=1 Tax=Roseimicrobium sp. ORNL1 TaxID=2711231 RepID=UPI0013E0F007|nr:SGNH/GDSL hydrolase family protein [Roseimicrobium sp. ORNL1]QIF02740.1 SGNH/GDSL hydrolase family protein [Roseimicrobium sp. ORNL1]